MNQELLDALHEHGVGWSYKIPEEEGLYLCNYGDIVSANYCGLEDLRKSNKHSLVNEECLHATTANFPSCKWLKLDLELLNKLTNLD